MDTIKVTYCEDGIYSDLRHLGARYGVSLGGAISSTPQIGLVVHDAVLHRGYSLETEPFRQLMENGKRRRVSTSLDVADMYERATRRTVSASSNGDEDNYFVDVHVDDEQAERAAKKGMTSRQLTAFGLQSLIAFSQIHEQTPFIDNVLIVNGKGSLKGELQLQKHSSADRLHMRAKHTGPLGRMLLALKHAE